MDKKILELMNYEADRYPHALEKQYPRILNKIVGLWGKPSIHEYFASLMVDERGDRLGFPREVAADIASMKRFYQQRYQQGQPFNPWQHQPEAILQAVRQHHISYSVKGFLRASKQGMAQIVTLFLNGGMPVDSCNDRQWTPLMFAALHNHAETLRVLLKHDANVNHRNNMGCTPLYWAAFRGNIKIVQLLLSNGADANIASFHGWTPLMQAAGRGHLQVAKLLIDKGAAINWHTREGWTALHKAAKNGNLPELTLLLSKGADMTARLKDGSSVLDLAAQSGNDAVVDKLLAVRQQGYV